MAVAVGDGCTVAAVGKAFRELKTLGLTARAPRLLGVQAEGAGPIAASFRDRQPPRPVEARTVADSIGVGAPRNWKKTLQAVEESEGAVVSVSDDEILSAVRYTGMLAGVFAEPAAASVAGLRRAAADGLIGRRQTAVAMITGHGLKDVQSARRASGQPFDIPASGEGLEEVLARVELV